MSSIQINTRAGTTFRMNEPMARNLTDAEFLRFIDDAQDPIIRELARRLHDATSMRFTEELVGLESAIDTIAGVVVDFDNRQGDCNEMEDLISKAIPTLRDAIAKVKTAMEGLEDARD